jgi:hypothetical protein
MKVWQKAVMGLGVLAVAAGIVWAGGFETPIIGGGSGGTVAWTNIFSKRYEIASIRCSGEWGTSSTGRICIVDANVTNILVAADAAQSFNWVGTGLRLNTNACIFMWVNNSTNQINYAIDLKTE